MVERFERLIRRGQRTGEISRDLPPSWLVDALIALTAALRLSVIRLLAPT